MDNGHFVSSAERRELLHPTYTSLRKDLCNTHKFCFIAGLCNISV